MKKFLPLALTAFTLTACMGYQPLYAPVTAQTAEGTQVSRQVSIGSVNMQTVERNVAGRRIAQLLKQKLEQNFPATNGDITLSVSIEEQTRTLAVRRDAVDQRLELRLISILEFTNASGQIAQRTRASATAAYNVEDSPFGTDAGKDRARRAATDRLAEEITQKVLIFLNKQNQ